jgi:uncharacterized protein (DUF2267 family)
MDELVKMVADKAGISESQAKKAVATVIEFMNDKLPPPIGGKLDDFLSGNASEDTMSQLTKGLGGLLGKK